RTVQIDLGSRDGIQTNQPVLTADGLIGRVSSVGYLNSQVTLIGDQNCRVSAVVENASHDMGVLTVSGPLDASLVPLSYLASSANLKPGQNVLTSGLGGIFPKGIPIGKIVDAQSIEHGLATQARRARTSLGAVQIKIKKQSTSNIQHSTPNHRSAVAGVVGCSVLNIEC